MNSVHFTLILAAAPVMETFAILRIFFTRINLELLCADKDSLAEIGISVDIIASRGLPVEMPSFPAHSVQYVYGINMMDLDTTHKIVKPWNIL